jgi:small subunit ribosomal protein S16
MVRIRFRREGSRHQPSYRFVVADRESPRDGRFLEILGDYNPRTEPATVNLDEARLYVWLQKGAQPSESVVQVLKMTGAWARWERVRKGETAEEVLSTAGERPKVDPRTRREDFKRARASKKARAKEAGEASEQPAGEAAGA